MKPLTDADIAKLDAAPTTTKPAAPGKPLTDADIEAMERRAQTPARPLTDADVAQVDEAYEDVTALEAGVRAFAQGVSAEWADEGVALVKSAFTGRPLKDVLAEERAAFERSEKAFPKFSTAMNVAGGITTAFIPGLNLASRAAAGLRGAATVGAIGGAVMGAGASDSGTLEGLATSTAIGAVGGAALAPAGMLAAKGIAKSFKAIGKVMSGSNASQERKAISMVQLSQRMKAGEEITIEAAEEQLEALGDDVSLKIMETVIPDWRAIDRMERFDATKVDRDWVEWLLGRELPGEIDAPLSAKVLKEYEDVISKWNDNALDIMWRNHKKEKVLLEAVDSVKARMPEKFSKLDDPMASGFFNSPFKWLANTRGVLQRVDRATGLNLSGIEMKLSGAEIKFKNTIRPFVHKMDDLLREMSKDEHDRVVHELRTFEHEANLSPKAAAYNNFYKEVRTELEKFGVSIPERPVFMPRRAMMTDDARAKLISYTTANGINDEVLRSVSFLAGRRITDHAEARKFIHRDMLRTDIIKSITSRLEASASHARKNKVPELLLETDLRKATMQYLTSNFRAAIYREPLEELNMNIKALQQLGLEESAKFTRELYSRIMGNPGTARAYMISMSARLKALGQELIERDSKVAGKTLKMMPETLGWTLSHYYSNLLGASPKSVIRNGVQIYQTAIPELGLGEGAPLVQRAINKSLKNIVSSKIGVEEFLTTRNLSDKIDMEAVLSPMRSAVREAIGTDVPVVVLDKIANTAMWAFSKADQMNRYFAWHVGQELAEEIAKGGAVKFLAGMPAGAKAEVKDMLLRGATPELKEYMSRYIVAKTQFNYTRADLSKFGHEFGSAVNMFMKWPSTVGADVFNTWRAKQDNDLAVGVTEKYFFPYAMYVGAEALLRANDMSGPLKDFFIGNLATLSPITSIPDAVGLPPIIDNAGDLYDLGRAAISGDSVEFDRQFTLKKNLKRLEPLPGIGLGAATYRRLNKLYEGLKEDK